MKYLTFILLFLYATQIDFNFVKEDIKDYQNFCLKYHDLNSFYAYEFDKIVNNNIICKPIIRNDIKFYKPIGRLNNKSKESDDEYISN